MTREEAIKMGESGWWKGMAARDVAEFQLLEPLMCMPFGEFHKATEEAMGRPVFTHEFAYPKDLLSELRGEYPPRTMQEIMDLIPADKRIIVVAP